MQVKKNRKNLITASFVSNEKVKNSFEIKKVTLLNSSNFTSAISIEEQSDVTNGSLLNSLEMILAAVALEAITPAIHFHYKSGPASLVAVAFSLIAAS